MEESVQETAASSQEYSSYPSSQCPDEFVDSEDEIIETLGACQLGEGGPSRTRVPSKAPYDSVRV
jgi:hypothetical protein